MQPESTTHPDAPRAGGETPGSRPALDLPAFKELLGEFAASVRGDERGYDVREFITKAREALIRYVEELHAEAIAKTIWRSRESDERAGEVDYDAADFTANEMLDDPSTPSAEWNLADAYLALRAALLARHRDGEREAVPTSKITSTLLSLLTAVDNARLHIALKKYECDGECSAFLDRVSLEGARLRETLLRRASK